MSQNLIRVSVVRVGAEGDPSHVVYVAPGSSVRECIEEAGLTTTGYQITRNGRGTTPDATVEDNDLLLLNTKVTGGLF